MLFVSYIHHITITKTVRRDAIGDEFVQFLLLIDLLLGGIFRPEVEQPVVFVKINVVSTAIGEENSFRDSSNTAWAAISRMCFEKIG